MSTRPFSARWRAETLGRLERRAEQTGETKSRLAERYVEEGLRMEEHPGILFRPGVTGRRAAVTGGPDVWQVITVLQASELSGEAAVEASADFMSLKPMLVRAAIGYYAAYPDEIDERIKRNVDEADAAEAAWRREQAALP